MHQKRRFRGLLFVLGFVAVLALGSLAGERALRDPVDRLVEEIGNVVYTIETSVGDRVDANDLLKGAIIGMLQNLDPHSNFMDEKAYARMLEEQKGSFYGIGISIQMVDGQLTVIAPIPGTPGHRAGLRTGDVIAAIDGEPTWGKGLVQTLYPLSFQTAVAITTARYYTPSGRLIQRPYASYFEYFFPDIQANHVRQRQTYATDLGRKVLGEGGIQPDVVVEGYTYPDVLKSILSADRYVFLKFSRRFAPIEKAAEERAHHSTRRLLSRDFAVDDGMLNEFLEFLKTQGIRVDPAAFDAHRDAIRRILRRELLDALWGESVGYRYFLTFDPQYKAARTHIPDAARMWQQRLARMSTSKRSTTGTPK